MKALIGTRNWMLAGSAALVVAATLVSAPAQAASASVYVQIAPPAPRVEVVPVARHGQTWVPGHWEWRHRQYAWVPGYFVTVRPGYYYAQPQWVQYGNRWGYQAGGWSRGRAPGHGYDRDHDGVPNRYDRRPDNPTRH